MSVDVVVHVIDGHCNNSPFIVGRHEEKPSESCAAAATSWRSSYSRLQLEIASPNPSGSHDSEETEGSSRLSSVLIGDHPVSWLYVSGPSSDLRLVFKLLHHGDLVTKEPLSQELG